MTTLETYTADPLLPLSYRERTTTAYVKTDQELAKDLIKGTNATKSNEGDGWNGRLPLGGRRTARIIILDLTVPITQSTPTPPIPKRRRWGSSLGTLVEKYNELKPQSIVCFG